MSMNKSFIMCLVLILSSCVDSKIDKELQDAQHVSEIDNIKKWYYEDSTLKKVQQFDEDGIENGIYKFYYPNGILEDSAWITNGMFHGVRFQYFETGKLKILSNYWRDQCRNATDFRKNGTLKIYRAYGYENHVMFITHYDENGSYLNHQGDLIYNIVLNDTIDRLSNQKIESLIASPPRSSVNVVVYQKKGKFMEIVKEGVPDFANRFVFTVDLSKKEKNEYLYKIEIFDSTSLKVLNDSAILQIGEKGETLFID